MTRYVAVLFLALAGVASSPAAASAACVAGVVVDGRFLPATGRDAPSQPPRDGPYPAVQPGCNDTGGPREPDTAVTVIRLRGVPTDVAVASSDGRDLYLAQGALTAMRSHPLHAVTPRRSRKPGCRPGPRITGPAAFAGSDSVTIRVASRERLIRIDARSRLINRPATQVVHPGQPLILTTSRCRSRLVADTIAFRGPDVEPERFRPDPGGSALVWPYALLSVAGLGVAAALGMLRPRGAVTWAACAGAVLLAMAVVVFVITARS